ncbi:gluconate 2-dehydrogenase subunit 3 family protein [Thalassotalea sp. 1_MG-2023]|uniref:gluconate 2-dehydrogenase subunit 3 family protein n=1 Tax=Thalassotalea sp. 1_MG-2023 TaxID=3062680 RepID=UPI0026E3EBEC|nr:gluconate 2-dehydrogenase subunit 3 family protein [Thalassotalea sp. 1_MG-2023]MDO6426093.1 gluconate 2-dehydrogenase subunit 3 family protein [Thalassotalea sp. 1_MG-2023]
MSESFEQRYQQTPSWLSKKLNRRKLLKSAAGASALVSTLSLSAVSEDLLHKYQQDKKQGDWQTLDAVQKHLLPSSTSGPSAKEINACLYLYLLVYEQPTDKEEVAFIFQGVQWLNGYTNKRYNQLFIALTDDEKQQVLTGISRSTAGKSWLNMMILNIYEAMLSPPVYGGNPKGIGWQWLAHQMGFPLPEKGKRYYELPARSTVAKAAEIPIKNVTENIVKRPPYQRSDKA